MSALGQHHNSGKLRLDLVPPEAVEIMATVLGRACEPKAGEQTYPERDWEKGLEYMAQLASVKRHLLEWEKRNDTDPQFGLAHLDHALVRLAMLATLVKRNLGKDDRPRRAPKLSIYDPYSVEFRFTPPRRAPVLLVPPKHGSSAVMLGAFLHALLDGMPHSPDLVIHDEVSQLKPKKAAELPAAAPKPAEKYTPNVGDWVRVTESKGSSDGTIGARPDGHVFKVERISKRFEYNNGGIGEHYFGGPGDNFYANVEKWEPKLGDWVRVTESECKSDRTGERATGFVFKVQSVQKTVIGSVKGNWYFDCKGEPPFFASVEPCEEPAKKYTPKKGDRVRVTRSDCRFDPSGKRAVGHVFTVDNFEPSTDGTATGAWFFWSDSGSVMYPKKNGFWADVEICTDYVPKAGDWVEVIEVDGGNAKLGDRFRVPRVCESDKGFFRFTSKKGSFSFRAKVKQSTQPKAPPIEVGSTWRGVFSGNLRVVVEAGDQLATTFRGQKVTWDDETQFREVCIPVKSAVEEGQIWRGPYGPTDYRVERVTDKKVYLVSVDRGTKIDGLRDALIKHFKKVSDS